MAFRVKKDYIQPMKLRLSKICIAISLLRNLNSVLVCSLILFLIGCKDNEEILPLKPEIITSGSLVGYAVNQEDRIIASQADWTKFIDDYNFFFDRFGDGEIVERNLDFSKNQILVVFDALKGTTGYSMEFDSLIHTEDNVTASFIHHNPPNDISITESLTQSYYILKIPKFTKPLFFKHTTVSPWMYGELIFKGGLSGNENIPQQALVVSNNEDWILLLNQMNSFYQNPNFPNNYPNASVNFDQNLVIAVFDKVNGYCCGTIDITDILEEETTIRITVRFLLNGALAKITQPIHVVQIPHTTKVIQFEYK